MAQKQSEAKQSSQDEPESSEEGQSSKQTKQGQAKSSRSGSGSSSSRRRAPAKKTQSRSSKKPADESEQSSEQDEAAEDDESAQGSEQASADDGGSIKPPKQMRGQELVAKAKSLVHELTGRRPESVSGLERTGDGWRVTFEFLELSRVPPTTDVLGTYHLDVTEDGEVGGLKRVRRYLRNQPEDGDQGS